MGKTCFTHRCVWHEGSTCKSYTADLLAKDKAHENVLKAITRCPGCGHGVIKADDEGCDHMTCICRHDFCWSCLVPYDGPMGIRKIGNGAHKPSCRFYA
jgi:hypothetical protein